MESRSHNIDHYTINSGALHQGDVIHYHSEYSETGSPSLDLEVVRKCLGSLYFEKLDDRQHNIRECLPETCNWLFHNPAYRQWYDRQNLEDHHGLLWIKGKPGSGKSTLMKEAYSRARQQLPAVSTTIAAFFFNARGTHLEKSLPGLFRSVLYQILTRDFQLLDEEVRKCQKKDSISCQSGRWDWRQVSQSFPLLAEMVRAFEEKEHTPGKSGRWEWHLDELQSFFKSAFTKRNGQRTIMFVDAVDECDEKDMRDLVNCFRDVTSSAFRLGSDLNICLSSRHYPTITASGCREIIVERGNSADIAMYVRVKLRQFPDDGGTISFLEEQIVRIASGVFLWVELVIGVLIRAIEDGKLMKDLKDILQDVPESLGALFSGLLETLAQNERVEALRLVQWVLLAKRPLNPEELCLAIAFTSEARYASLQEWKTSDSYVSSYQQMVKRIRSYSRGLIEVTGNVVQFIHESVRELFLRGNGFAILNKSPMPCPLGDGHSSIARACLNLISVEELGSLYPTSELARLLSNLGHLGWQLQSLNMTSEFHSSILEYAIKNLFYHFRQAEDNGVAPHHLVDRLRKSNMFFWKRWKTLYHAVGGYGAEFANDVSLLYVLCAEQAVSCAVYILGLGADPNEAGASARYPIIAAARGLKSPVKLVEALLQYKADVSVRDSNGWTALHTAAKRGSEAVVRLLLEHGASPNAKTYNGETALLIAAENEHAAIVPLLEEHNAIIDVKDSCTQNVLLRAARCGREVQVRLLLDRKAKVYMNEPDGQVTPHGAVRNGHEALPLLPLDQQENDGVKDAEGLTALCWAACRGDEAVVRLLLRHKFNFSTALHQAAEWGHEAMARRLLEHGADINKKDGKGMTALHKAVTRPDEVVTRLLLEFKADIDAKTHYEETALHLLIERWSEEVARLLLKHKANVDMRDMMGMTVLHCAVTKGHKSATLLLLEHGADVNAKDKWEMTPLHLAARHRDEAVARVLLEYRADISAKDLYGRTALHIAANGDAAVVRLLLMHKAGMNEKDNKGKTAMHLAAEWGCEVVVRLLLEHKANINAMDNDGKTPLDEAIKSRQLEIVQLLTTEGGSRTG